MVLTIATSGFLTALECTKFVFGRGFAQDLTGGATPPDPLAGLRGPTFKGRGKGRTAERGRRGGENGRDRPPFANSWIRL